MQYLNEAPEAAPLGRWDWARLRGVAYREARLILDPDQAQDAAQEALVRAWRRRHAMTGADAGPWVRTIARREALRIAAQRRPGPVPSGFDEPSMGHEPDVVHERLDLRRAVARLSAGEQQDLLLRYWADLTNQGIAERTGRPVGSVKVRLHRAHSKLASALAGPEAK